MKTIITCIVIVLDAVFLFYLIKDIFRHRSEVKAEPGRPVLLSIYTCILFFLSTLGIPDFPISSMVYGKTKWVPDKKLPGTLVCESVIPCTFMAIGYFSFTTLDVWTLTLPIFAQLLGGIIGPKISMHLPEKQIKVSVSIGMLLAAVMLLLSKLSLIPSAGSLNGFTGWRLWLCVIFSFLCGILNNIGIGSFSVMLAFLYLLGLSSISAYPIMMGAAALSTPVAGVQFVRGNAYARKVVLFSSIFGSIGACLAVTAVKHMDISVLQWIIMGILFYSAISTMRQLIKAKKLSLNESPNLHRGADESLSYGLSLT